MNIRRYTVEDYKVVTSWWKAHNWPILPEQYLPKTGYVISNICAGWLYRTDSKIAWIEWIISNPKSNKLERAIGIKLLVKTLLDKAKELGFDVVFSSIKHPNLMAQFKSQGFVVADEGMINMINRLEKN